MNYISYIFAYTFFCFAILLLVKAKSLSSFLKNTSHTTLAKHLPKVLLASTVLYLFIFCIGLLFTAGLIDTEKPINEFGDFIGGTLSSTFAFLSFVAILSNIHAQESSARTDQFFKLLDYWRSIAVSADYRYRQGDGMDIITRTGPLAFASLARNYLRFCPWENIPDVELSFSHKKAIMERNYKESSRTIIENSPSSILIYYELACRIFDLIEKDGEEDLKVKLGVMRALMSTSEIEIILLLAIHYNTCDFKYYNLLNKHNIKANIKESEVIGRIDAMHIYGILSAA